MLKIPAWLSLAVKIILFILPAVATAAATGPEHFGGKVVAGNISYWLTLASTLIAGVSTLVGSGAVPSQTIVGKITGWALAFFATGMLLLALQPGSAVAAPKTLSQIVSDIKGQVATLNGKVTTLNSKVGLTGSPTADLNALVTKIQDINLADLKAAKSDADATKDALASACYSPLIDLVTAQQSVVAPGQNTENPGASVPTTHLILTFQRNRDLSNALRPGSTVSIGCAPLAEQVKLDVTGLIASIAAGTLSLTSFGL